MEVWSGSIPTGTIDLNVQLVNAFPKQDHNIPSRCRLSLHSFVNPALIPLYARAGPSVEVHTVNDESAEWLKTRLLGSLWLEELGDDDQEEAMERAAEIQCPVALLLTVDSQGSVNSTSNVSDLLVYGILTASNPDPADRLPSPSSPERQAATKRRNLRIYAAPLASSYVQRVQDLPSPPTSPIGTEKEANPSTNARGDDRFVAQFLPDLRSPTPKRKRMLSIFETAAQHHRRVRQYGGQAVAQIMASTTKSQTAHHQTPPPPPPSQLKIKREQTDDGVSSSNNNKSGLDRLGGWHKARSLSIGGSQLAKPEHARLGPDEARPNSSRGLQQQQAARRVVSKNEGGSHSFHELEQSRNSSNLAYSAEAATSTMDHDPSTLLLASSSPKTGEMLIATNKDVITRTILTGMRLYGYHRKTGRSSTSKQHTTASNTNDTDGMEDGGRMTPTAEDYSKQSVCDEEEFKALYHATYKAATFALRHYLKTDSTSSSSVKNDHADNSNSVKSGPPVLSRDTATNVIDEILRLFCDDQLKPAG